MLASVRIHSRLMLSLLTYMLLSLVSSIFIRFSAIPRFCSLLFALSLSTAYNLFMAFILKQFNSLISVLSFEFYDRMTMHRNRYLVNKTNRCTEIQFYWYYDSTCFGQPFCASSGVLSRTIIHKKSVLTF